VGGLAPPDLVHGVIDRNVLGVFEERHLQHSLKGQGLLAGDYTDGGKGCKRGTGEGEKRGRQVLMAIINKSWRYLLVSLFSQAFQYSWRSCDEPSDDALQSGHRAGETQVDAVSASVVERGSRGV
jgi:hypothetical protein